MPSTGAHPTAPRTRGSRNLRLAWWSPVLYPVAFVGAFVVGQAVPWWMGYDVATTEAPWWVMGLALTAALATFAWPLLVTALFSRRAVADSQPGARMPVLVGGIVVGGFALINLFSGLMMLIFE